MKENAIVKKTKFAPLVANAWQKILFTRPQSHKKTQKKTPYIGLTDQTFKKRITKHNFDFRHEEMRTSTKLSGHIWDLKDRNTKFEIKWNILSKAKPFSPVSGVCNLCTREKFFIVYKSELGTLNSRDEMKSNCRHKQSVLIDKTWTTIIPRDLR